MTSLFSTVPRVDLFILLFSFDPIHPQIPLTRSHQAFLEPLHKFFAAYFASGYTRNDVCQYQIVFYQAVVAPHRHQFDQIHSRTFVAVYEAVVGYDAVNEGGGLLMNASMIAVIGPRNRRLDCLRTEYPRCAPIFERFLVTANRVGPGDPVVAFSD